MWARPPHGQQAYHSMRPPFLASEYGMVPILTLLNIAMSMLVTIGINSLGCRAALGSDDLINVHGAFQILLVQPSERENFISPFSQHWLMRTRLGWSHQPS